MNLYGIRASKALRYSARYAKPGKRGEAIKRTKQILLQIHTRLRFSRGSQAVLRAQRKAFLEAQSNG